MRNAHDLLIKKFRTKKCIQYTLDYIIHMHRNIQKKYIYVNSGFIGYLPFFFNFLSYREHLLPFIIGDYILKNLLIPNLIPLYSGENNHYQ